MIQDFSRPSHAAPQGDYPGTTIAGQVDAINGGGKHLISVDNHGTIERNTVSSFASAQGSANADIGYAQGQAFPEWTQQIGEQSHITGTTATAVKATTGVLIQLNVNTPAAGTITLFDLASGNCTGTPSTNVRAILTTIASTQPVPITFNAHFANGICLQASVAMDLTAVYQ